VHPSLPHLVVSAVVVDGEARHLLLVRDAPAARWHLVTGHVVGGESLAEAARREVRERTGLTRFSVVEPHLAVQQDLLECHGVEARHIDHVFAAVVSAAEPVVEGLLDEAGLVGWFHAHHLPDPLAPGVRLHLAGTTRLVAEL
jgi:ADP-ribose pyrophosphatase YjhB (NUDIX family)